MARFDWGTLFTLAGLGVGAYVLYEWAISPDTAQGSPTPAGTPGTTTTMQQQQTPTSISTTPPATSPAPPPPPPTVNLTPVTPANLSPTDQLISQMQPILGGAAIGTADQWNYAYRQITGRGIEQAYGFNFDAVYGPVVNGSRNSGMLTGSNFLLRATTAGIVPHSLTGIGALIQRFPPGRALTYRPTHRGNT